MCAIIKSYELYLVRTGELLSNNLDFDDVPELYQAYEDFYGHNSILVCYRTHSKSTPHHITPSQVFKNMWVDYFGELQILGNL